MKILQKNYEYFMIFYENFMNFVELVEINKNIIKKA